MDVLIGLVMIVAGFRTAFSGELKISATRTVRGVPARIAGCILIAALPLAFLILMGLAVMEEAGAPLLSEYFASLSTYVVMFLCAMGAIVVAAKGLAHESGVGLPGR